MPKNFSRITHTVWWNIFIITIGSIIFSTGLKGIAVHHNFIPGGIFGLGLLIYYIIPVISAGILYFIINIPLFAISWFYTSKKFFYYSLYAMTVATIAYEFLNINFGIQDQFHAAIAAGAICGAGCGIVLRSFGSNGGLDVIAVMLNQKYGLEIGKFYFITNFLLFSGSLFVLEIDLIIASLVMVFIMSFILEYTLGMFEQRKLVLIISDKSQGIVNEIRKNPRMGATLIKGKGAYSGSDKEIIMTITNNIMLKRLEQTVFSKDANAIFIAEKTFHVLGPGFAERKIYDSSG